MKNEGAIVVFGIMCLVWHAQAQVNCTATGAGRFAEPSDTTCKNYTLCVLNSNTGDYISYNYVCPTTSVFNPNSRLCTTNYTCTNTSTTPAASVCTADGFIADPASTDCTSYLGCVDDGTGVFTEITYPCPTGTFYDPETTLCETSYVCPTTFNCSSPGRYANTTDTTCQSYHFCVLASNGTFVQYDYTCPNTAVFSPTTSVCTTTYTCPTILCLPLQSLAEVNCQTTGAGRFADQKDPTCKNYTLCLFNSNTGIYLSYNYVCPEATAFDPSVGLCTSNYTCPVLPSSTTTVTGAPSSACSSDGYIANPNSEDCASYIECVNINGFYTETIYNCPGGTFFDPNTTLCDPNYTCVKPFTCSAVGRYADTSDPTCQTYFLCVLAGDGTFLEYTFNCPSNSFFSPNSKVCTTNYSCNAKASVE